VVKIKKLSVFYYPELSHPKKKGMLEKLSKRFKLLGMIAKYGYIKDEKVLY
jgi:hypothetical protein